MRKRKGEKEREKEIGGNGVLRGRKRKKETVRKMNYKKERVVYLCIYQRYNDKSMKEKIISNT